MKIIFLKDVPRIAKKYDIKDVADGHGRHLIMQKVAELATKEALTRIETKKLADVSQKKMNEELLMKTLATLDGASITFFGKANEKGHLFASIHREEVLAELKRALRIDLHPDYLVLDKPLKELGEFQIPVVVGKSRAVLTVNVQAEK